MWEPEWEDKGRVIADPIDEPQQCPWSKKALRRTGKALVQGADRPRNTPSFEEVALWYGEVQGFVQQTLLALELGRHLTASEPPVVTARVKTDDTLRDKLIREPTFPLPAVQDIAGIRFEADMDLTEQDIIARSIYDHFVSIDWNAEIKDHRDPPGYGNYRAVHLRLERPEDGARAEVQIRTSLQSLWANIYERLGDRLGRKIRYGELPEDEADRMMVVSWQEISIATIATLESVIQSIPELEAHASALNDSPDTQHARARLEALKSRAEKHRLSLQHSLSEAVKSLDQMESQG